LSHRLTVILSLFAAFCLWTAALAGEDVTLYDGSGKVLKPSQINRVSIRKTCGDCHDVDAKARSLHFNKGEAKPDPEASDCLSCHMPGKNAFNADGTVTKMVSDTSNETCASCHSDVIDAVKASVHGRADKVAGDHPGCKSCHGGNPHAIKPVASLTRRAKAEMCSGCHRVDARMKRYGVVPSAVGSYEQSFHGKALLRFGKEKSAGCTDCHGYHGVIPLTNGASFADREKLLGICAKCHPGAKADFCMSGASHMRLKIDSSIILRLEDLFFKALTYGTMAFLMGMIALDLRRKVFSRDRVPESGRFITVLIALSFSALVAGLVLGVIRAQGAEWAWVASVALMAVALAVHFIVRKPRKVEKRERLYLRFSLSQRAQHICLAVSFTVLVLTGMPLRYAQVGWSHYLQLLFGGFDGARIAHRVAAVILTGTWIWHFIFLLYRWRVADFTLSSWTMMPTKKDFTDFFDTVKYGLGLRETPPQYDRFHFREKFDYFAVYWGMPVMVLSGAVLWFPVFFGNRLTDLGLGVAYIAHSDEALLALLAILVWHLYNTHFDPDHFPMSTVWYSGVLTESQMEREHPIEKSRLNSTGKPGKRATAPDAAPAPDAGRARKE
jgi:cytochrome b subunit of formate dehydrogenase